MRQTADDYLSVQSERSREVLMGEIGSVSIVHDPAQCAILPVNGQPTCTVRFLHSLAHFALASNRAGNQRCEKHVLVKLNKQALKYAI